MRAIIGYMLLGLGVLVAWPVQIGIWLFGIYYIITAFINSGIFAGLISISIVVVGSSILFMIIHFLSLPYIAVVNALLERQVIEEREKNRMNAECEMLAGENIKSLSQSGKWLAKAGMSSEEIEKEIEKRQKEADEDFIEREKARNIPKDARKEIVKLHKMVKHHKHLYYDLNSPEISDDAYDHLKHRLYLIEQAYPRQALTGSVSKGRH
jgi:hypothetical protein